MYRMTPRLQRSHFLSYEKASPVNVSTTSGAMYSAEPTGVSRMGVVMGVCAVDGAMLAKSKSHIQTGVTYRYVRVCKVVVYTCCTCECMRVCAPCVHVYVVYMCACVCVVYMCAYVCVVYMCACVCVLCTHVVSVCMCVCCVPVCMLRVCCVHVDFADLPGIHIGTGYCQASSPCVQFHGHVRRPGHLTPP